MWLIVSLLVLSLLIFFHELGHFLVARAFGVKVEVFSIGFGKKIWSKTYGDTEYAISVIPLGGYVKMKGQDDLNPTLNSKDDDSYNTKAPWKRICILLAGPFGNILLAFVLYLVIAFCGTNALLPVIGKIMPNSPALSAGLQVGDKIIKIDDKPIKSWRNLVDYVSQKQESMNLVYERNGKVFETQITPQIRSGKNIFGENVNVGMIGIVASGEVGKIKYSLDEILPFAIDETIYSSTLIILSIQKLIAGIISTSELGGPIAIVQVISQAQEVGIIALLGLSALISINLGILNLLPIPALDGGHIIFTLYEWITRKPLNENIIYKLTIVGWILLFCLMALGVYNDISRIIAK